MRVRNLTELSQNLDDELAWRKKELTTLQFMVAKSRPHEEALLLRAGICLLYAHWEGFIRSAAVSYISFVSFQGLSLRDLSPNFLALALLSNVQNIEQDRAASIHGQITESFRNRLSERFGVNGDRVINTRSNLNSKVLNEILHYVGVETADYQTKKQILDERLLRNRNMISHGRRLEIQQHDYLPLHAAIIDLVERFRTDIENAAAVGKYRTTAVLT